MDKPLSGQRIKVCGERQNNREEPRDREPEGGMRQPRHYPKSRRRISSQRMRVRAYSRFRKQV
jgi:hypothetical protein